MKPNSIYYLHVDGKQIQKSDNPLVINLEIKRCQKQGRAFHLSKELLNPTWRNQKGIHNISYQSFKTYCAVYKKSITDPAVIRRYEMEVDQIDYRKIIKNPPALDMVEVKKARGYKFKLIMIIIGVLLFLQGASYWISTWAVFNKSV